MSRDRSRSRPYDPGVIPLVLAIAGVLAIGMAFAILRGFGPGYRVGRLLAVAPRVSVAEAIRMATAGESAYVRVDGRIDSEHEFEDEHHRPLVLRRTSLHWRPATGAGGRGRSDTAWLPIGAPRVEHVPFVVSEGLDDIAVDGAALAEGLVVVPRISTGTVGDLGARAPADMDPSGAARQTVEQVSSVEHATVLGVPGNRSGWPSVHLGRSRPTTRPHDPRAGRGDARPHRRRPTPGAPRDRMPRRGCRAARRRDGRGSSSR